tara:strand:- start:82463 stop:83326 length:864 start_codon:yes stop_codon:yes gene_type:complete
VDNLPSRFLPADFDPSKPIAVVAGQRDYPILAVASIRAAGLQVRLIAFEGETDDALYESFGDSERAKIKVGQVGKMLKALQRMNCGYAIFVGQITPGRLFRDLKPDLKAIAMLAMLKERNAETIFGSIVAEVQKVGVSMLDARAFMDDHLASVGLMTRGKLKADQEHIDFGVQKAREIAALDIGQGVVVRKGTVLAVEAFEGTDDMLARANKYKTEKLIFVKTSKPTQKPFFDWPCFGEKTLETMASSGISTAALEADCALLLGKPGLIEKANQLGIELIGYTTQDK